jgi:hypothetical protein
MPAESIWQWKPCELVNTHVRKALQCNIYIKENQRLTLVLLLRAGELNVREVPEVTEPVFVTVSAGLADREAKGGELRGENNNEVLRKRTRNTEVTPFDEGASNSKNLIGK